MQSRFDVQGATSRLQEKKLATGRQQVNKNDSGNPGNGKKPQCAVLRKCSVSVFGIQDTVKPSD